MQAQRGVAALYRDFFLGEDRAGIGPFDHAVQGHAGFTFAIDQHPVGRRTTAIARQQRTVQVERALSGRGQQRLAEQVAVIKREQVIGVELGDAFDPQRMIDVFRRVHRDPLTGAQLRNRAVEGVFLRIIGMGEHGGNLVTAGEQGFDAGTANIVIGEDNSFCAHERT
ncbi:hypothetical protein D3C84_888900 [compost metagenome]